MPEKALLASLGCGNPTALAQLNPGETVLDLGSGGGIDVLLSARRVGPDGQGLRSGHDRRNAGAGRENQRKAGIENVEFLKGEIENIPLPDESVDVIISNCVINLSADKDRVLREAFRVLKPGGRVAVSDVVVRGEILPRSARACWRGSAALPERWRRPTTAANWQRPAFEQIEIEPTRIYRAEDAREFLAGQGIDVDALAPQVDGKFLSAVLARRETKPRTAGMLSFDVLQLGIPRGWSRGSSAGPRRRWKPRLFKA